MHPCENEHPEKVCLTQDLKDDDPSSVRISAQSDTQSLQSIDQMPTDLSLNPEDYRPAEVTENIPGNVGAMISEDIPGRHAYLRKVPCAILKGL